MQTKFRKMVKKVVGILKNKSLEYLPDGIKVGSITRTGFALVEKIESLDQFLDIINRDESLFARHKMYPTAFIGNWNFRLVSSWIKRGWFYRAVKLKRGDLKDFYCNQCTYTVQAN